MIDDSRVSRAARSQSPALGALLLPQMSLFPIAYNREALEILAFPRSPEDLVRSSAALARRIETRLVSRSAKGARKFVAQFQSGNRTYHCRTLNVRFGGEFGGENDDDPSRATTLILLERSASPSRLLKRQAWDKFGLAPRERQIIELLIEGMTTKEMAQALRLSPNTIKSFLRLVMAKMGVSTRSGIVGKLLET